MSNILTQTLKFPPVTFLLIFLVSLTAFQGYVQYAGAGHTQEVQHIEPTISTDGDTYPLGSWMKITIRVAEDHHHDEGGHDEEAGDHQHEEEVEEAEDHHHGEEQAEDHPHDDKAEEAEDHHHDEAEAAEDHHHDEEEEGAEDHHHDNEEADDHGGEGQLEGSVVRITIYSPDGNIFAIKEGVIDRDGEVTFDVFVGPESPAGTYSVVAEATVKGLPTVIGETVTIKVED
ncbi:MAG: hypothetical protein ACE5KU_01425 [Nitrososphaerales archaeon]